MPQSKTDFEAAMKENYGPGLRNAVNNSNPILTEAEHDDQSIIGDQAVWSVHTGRSASTGNRAELVALPTADRQRYTKLREELVYSYHTIKVSGPAIELTRGDEGAFLRALEAEIDGAEKDIRNDFARQLFGQKLPAASVLQSGVLAVLTANPSSGTTLTIANASKAEMRYFFRNMYVRLINPASGAVRPGTYQVTAIDKAAKTLTIGTAADSSIVSGDYVVRASSDGGHNFGQEINGLRHLVSATDAFAGVDPATVPEWAALTAGSPTTPISEVILEEASELVMTDGDGTEPNLWVAEYDQRRKLASTLQAQKRYDGVKTTLQSGWKGLEIAQGVLVADRYCPTNVVFGIRTAELKRFVGLDWTWDERGGGTLYKALDGSDAIEARFKAYHQMAVTNRNSHVRVTLSTPTF